MNAAGRTGRIVFLLVTLVQPVGVVAEETPLQLEAVRLAELFAPPCDADAVSAIFNFRSLVDRVAAELELDPKLKEGFLSGMARSGLGTQLCTLAGPNGSFDLLHGHAQDSAYHATFRLISDEGLNYFVFRIEEVDGSPRVTDFLNFATIERISERLTDSLVQLAAQQNRNIIEKWLGKKSWVDYVGNLNSVNALITAGELDAARDELDTVPLSIQETRVFLALRFNLAVAADDWAERMAISERFTELAAGRPEAHLMLIDIHLSYFDTEAALHDIDELDRFVGGDPYLNVLRANVLLIQEDYYEGRIAAEAALEHEFWQSLWTILQIDALEKNHAHARGVLESMAEKLATTPEEIESEFSLGEKRLRKFLRSRTFRRWKKQF